MENRLRKEDKLIFKIKVVFTSLESQDTAKKWVLKRKEDNHQGQIQAGGDTVNIFVYSFQHILITYQIFPIADMATTSRKELWLIQRHNIW